MSTLDTKPIKGHGNDLVLVASVAEGAASSIVSGVRGKGVTVTRTGAGLYLATFDDRWSSLVTCFGQTSAATPANIGGLTVHFDEASTTAGVISIAFSIYEHSTVPTLHDLAADEYVELTFIMRSTGY